MPNAVFVTHDRDDRFSAKIRDHIVHVDQTQQDGGTDTAPTPTELFVASLATCVAFYARRYLRRHELPQEGLTVAAEADFGSNPSRVAGIRLVISLPEGVPDDRREALLAVASRCTVGNTLSHEPEVSIALA